MNYKIYIFAFLLFSLNVADVLAQEPAQQSVGQPVQQENLLVYDTADLFTEKSKLNPTKAAVFSAVLPGLGQIYNKQAWKLPFIYGGLFTIGYFVNYNHEYFLSLRNALIAETDPFQSTQNPFQLSADALNTRVEQFRRDRDYLIIVGVITYLLNVVDAHISAHLEEFAINDELSIGFKPTFNRPPNGITNAGFSIVLNIK
ncbi:MAG: DUF5683 domain-containing protein [Bacteroidota bacterium]